jgi:hypothetical protein
MSVLMIDIDRFKSIPGIKSVPVFPTDPGPVIHRAKLFAIRQ